MTENDKEHKAFEEFGNDVGLDMCMHPLHLLYLNDETGRLLQAFKAGYAANSSKEGE